MEFIKNYKPTVRFRPLLKKSLIVALVISSTQFAVAASSSLSISGKDGVTNSPTQVKAGNDIDWIASYNNTSSSPASVVLDNTIAQGHSFKSGSVQYPPGWSVGYSTNDGDSYSSTDTGSLTTDLQFSNPLVANPSNGASDFVNEPLSAAAQSGTGEDAYIPIPYKGKIYGLIHHSTDGGHEIVCSLPDGTVCSGYPAALDLGGQTDFLTSINPLHYIDQTNDRLFFAAQRNIGYGIVCWDFSTVDMCSGNEYTELSSSGGALGASQPSRLLGVINVGSCLYAWDVDNVMYSFDPSSFATTCGGFSDRNLGTTYAIPSYLPNQHNFGVYQQGAVASAEVIDNKIYYPVNYAYRADINFFCGLSVTNYCLQSRLVCFDPLVANGQCTSWTTPNLGGNQSNLRAISLIFKDVGNNDNPCVLAINLTPGTYSTLASCYNKTTGAGEAVPANLQANVINNARGLNGEGGSSTYLFATYEEIQTTNDDGQDIVIFPFAKVTSGNSIRGGAGCYNWTTGDECSSWGSNSDGETTWLSVNDGDTRDYGYTVDEAGCVLGLGDSGWVWSFNADDGSLPCRRTVSNVSLNPQAYYCAGDGNVTNWNQVALDNVNIADFDEVLVTIRDENGVIVSGFDSIDVVPLNGVFDISSIPYSGDTEDLDIDVLLVALNSDPWSGSNDPIVTATFNGDDAQFCFQTVAQDNCLVPSISNVISSTTTQLSDSSVSIQNASRSLGLILSDNTVCSNVVLTGGGAQGDVGKGSSGSDLTQTGYDIRIYLLIGAFLVITSGVLVIKAKKQKKPFGGPGGTRTLDTLLKRQVL